MITPRQRAMQVVETVAARHGMTAATLFERTKRRDTVRARRIAAVTVVQELNWTQAEVARLFGLTRPQVHRALRLVQIETSPRQIETRRAQNLCPDDLEWRLRQLSGVELAPQLTHRLGLKPWIAQFLAIVVEAYPRAISHSRMCELYDLAQIGTSVSQSEDEHVSEDMCKQAITRGNKAFEDMGLGRPMVAVPHSRACALSEDMAPWFRVNYGAPA